MKSRNERILDIANEIASQNSINNYESFLDEMLIGYLEGDSEDKASAYFFVTQIKVFLKISCEDFFSYEKLSEVNFTGPRDEFERNLKATIQDHLENHPKWSMIKRIREKEQAI